MRPAKQSFFVVVVVLKQFFRKQEHTEPYLMHKQCIPIVIGGTNNSVELAKDFTRGFEMRQR